MTALHGKQYFPETADRKGHGINRNKVPEAMPEVVPHAGRVVTGKHTDQSVAPAFTSGDTHIGHDGVGLETDIPHTVEHGGKRTEPHGDHDALKIDTVAHMGRSFCYRTRRIKNSVNRFVKGIPLFKAATFFKMRFQIVENSSQTHDLTLLLNTAEIVTENRAVFIFARANVGTQRQIFFVQFEAAQILRHLCVPYDEGTQQLGRQNI